MNTTIEDVKQYFDQFGKVRDVYVCVKVVGTSRSVKMLDSISLNITQNRNKDYFASYNGFT